MSKRKIFINGITLMLACALSGCGSPVGATSETEQPIGEMEKAESDMSAVGETGTVEDEIPPPEVRYTLWDAYWNLEGVEEQTEELAEHVENVNFFAAYFDQNDDAFIPEAIAEFYTANADSYGQRGWNCYLTVVNDQILSDGSSSLKSTELLYRLLENEEAYQAHAESLLTLASENDYDGLEIDYENIRKDDVLWGYFMNFISYLYDRCEEEGLLLRVVIETNINADKIDWVSGPEYCVMCYNLYGSHGDPGPKADKAFLQEIMEKMKYVPGNVDYALANGGFDWGSDGTVTSLTVKQAETLRDEWTAEVIADDSGAKVFYFTDENGVSHEVWYGDRATLEIWMGWLQEGGNWNYSIWRMGE